MFELGPTCEHKRRTGMDSTIPAYDQLASQKCFKRLCTFSRLRPRIVDSTDGEWKVHDLTFLKF